MSSGPVVVQPVASSRDLNDFVALPKRLYRGRKGYVAPLDLERKETLSKKKNPFFGHAEGELFVAGDMVARGYLRSPDLTKERFMREPDADQRRVLTQLADLSARVVVMTDRARTFLREIYGVPEGKIDLIAHGIPDTPFVDPAPYKDQFDVGGQPPEFVPRVDVGHESWRWFGDELGERGDVRVSPANRETIESAERFVFAMPEARDRSTASDVGVHTICLDVGHRQISYSSAERPQGTRFGVKTHAHRLLVRYILGDCL